VVIARADAVAALADNEFDMVVVGGGITGAGVALDAAARGYSVALLERADFASGTSSRSSKLVHGGLRYLQHFDVGLVREALLERQLMVALAPHLVHPLPLVVAAFEGAHPDRLVGMGLNLYDVLSVSDRRSAADRVRARRGRRARAERHDADAHGDEQRERADAAADFWAPERHRVISGEEVLELLPALASREPTSGYLFYDCQTDDARLVLTVLGEAERFGAICANRLAASGLLERDGRARGVRVRDTESGSTFEIAARAIVNATGVWADELATPAGPGAAPGAEGGEGALPVIRPSRGTHLIVSHERLPLIAGAIVPAGAGRTIFALPWLGRTLIGTTDNDYEGPLDHVRPSPDDVGYLLDAVNEFFGADLARGDISGAFAGVRPLISNTDTKKSVDISRKAELYESPNGLITITGGKLTTWRRMAKLVVDRLVERDGRDARCRTAEIPLGQSIAPDELPALEGVSDASRAALAARYGYGAHELVELIRADSRLAEPIVPGLPDLLAEVALAARREQARSVADVLLRRTRIGLLAARELIEGDAPPQPGPSSPAASENGSAAPARIQAVAQVLAAQLGWDAQRTAAEARAFLAEARAEGILIANADD
jgi:glycerol-3-phosphate dehydrogenase